MEGNNPPNNGFNPLHHEQHDQYMNRGLNFQARIHNTRPRQNHIPKATTICAACNMVGHGLRHCSQSSPDGFVHGCPQCNSRHFYDTCTRRIQAQDWYLLGYGRDGLPPIRTGIDIRFLPQFNAHEDPARPHTATFAREHRYNPNDYAYAPAGSMHAERAQRIRDPAWENPEAIPREEICVSDQELQRERNSFTRRAVSGGRGPANQFVPAPAPAPAPAPQPAIDHATLKRILDITADKDRLTAENQKLMAQIDQLMAQNQILVTETQSLRAQKDQVIAERDTQAQELAMNVLSARQPPSVAKRPATDDGPESDGEIEEYSKRKKQKLLERQKKLADRVTKAPTTTVVNIPTVRSRRVTDTVPAGSSTTPQQSNRREDHRHHKFNATSSGSSNQPTNSQVNSVENDTIMQDVASTPDN
ncbi:hypothetical protein PVAG01_07538 [Phlyctema vagabunda]|uniref:Gag protein n=1 Tax=Phlyctema vagabunda TaxID=108571 RepID=A0ABR4PCP3_9HELO